MRNFPRIYNGTIIQRFGPVQGPGSQITYKAVADSDDRIEYTGLPFKRLAVADEGVDEPVFVSADPGDPCVLLLDSNGIRLWVRESMVLTDCETEGMSAENRAAKFGMELLKNLSAMPPDILALLKRRLSGV